MEKVTRCLVCGSESFQEVFPVTDYFLSKQVFTLVKCNSCGFTYLNNRPSADEASSFYKSTDYVSHSATKKGLVNKLYNRVRKYTLSKKEKMLRKHAAGKKLLDYGCGTGHFLHYCKSKGWDVSGIEPDPDARGYGIREFGLQISDIESINSLPENSFDLICSWHVFEHVYEAEELIRSFHRILKENGRLVLAVPNALSWDAGHYKEFWAAYDVPRHIWHFDPPTLSRFVSLHGFTPVQSRGMKFDAYYISLLSEKYKRGRSSLFCGFFNGLRSNLKACRSGNYSSFITVFRKK